MKCNIHNYYAICTTYCILILRLDCNFSFAGLKSAVKRITDELDSAPNHDGQDAVPFQDLIRSPVSGCEDIASSFQNTACSHLVTRTERAILYCKDRWPNISQLVCIQI